jgi:hypothetical protein
MTIGYHVTENEFYKFLDTLTKAQRVVVEDSATLNAHDTVYLEKARPEAELWDVAMATAEMILDCPEDYGIEDA